MTDETLDLERIGFDAHFRAQFAALNETLLPARVAIAYGESYIVWTARDPAKE